MSKNNQPDDDITIPVSPPKKKKVPKASSTPWLKPVLVGIIVLLAFIAGYFIFSITGNDTGKKDVLTIYEQNGKYGYKDQEGNIAIPARYDIAAPFHDNKAKVTSGDSIYYINKFGEMVELIKPGNEEAKPEETKPEETKQKEQKDKKEQKEETNRKLEEKAWKKAKSRNTEQSYKDYLNAYPHGKYTNQAKKRIKQLQEEKKRKQRKKHPSLSPILQRLVYNMVYVKGGTFTMGCTSEQGSDCQGDEKPAHQVTLSSYSIGKYEVTQEEWREVMGNNPSDHKNCDKCPVERVSWNDIQKFIKKLNQKTGKHFRLPTEAEWEYAARGGNRSNGYKYSGSDNLNSVAWYIVNSGSKTHPVGGKTANELGLYDMSGNVYEWCSDWYDSDYYRKSPESNPTGPSSGSNRVSRGGSWSINAQICRVAFRYPYSPGYRLSFVGFRLAH